MYVNVSLIGASPQELTRCMRWIHPNLVRIYGVDDDKKAGRLYVLIEFVGSSPTTTTGTNSGSLGQLLGAWVNYHGDDGYGSCMTD